MTGSSTQGIKTVLHPVSDLTTAKAVYAALLGVPPQTDSPYYVGFEAAGQHIGLLPGGGPQGMTCPVAQWTPTATSLGSSRTDECGAGDHHPHRRAPRAYAGT
jgi:hypothetical protein